MTSSKHSSTEPTGADDHFVESVFDTAGHGTEAVDAAAGAAGEDDAEVTAELDLAAIQEAIEAGIEDPSDPMEDLDAVADELARAARAFEHGLIDPAIPGAPAEPSPADPSPVEPVAIESIPAEPAAAEIPPSEFGSPGSPAVAPVGADPTPEQLAAELAEQVGLEIPAAPTRPSADPVDPVDAIAAMAGGRPDERPIDEPSLAEPAPPTPSPEAAPIAISAPDEPPAPVETPTPTSAPDEPEGYPIDQIAVRKLGGFNFLSVGQWASLPRDERARLLKSGMVQFLCEGTEVPTRPALIWLQRLARAEAPDPDDPPVRERRR